VRLDETEDRAQQPRNPGNVGLHIDDMCASASAKKVPGGAAPTAKRCAFVGHLMNADQQVPPRALAPQPSPPRVASLNSDKTPTKPYKNAALGRMGSLVYRWAGTLTRNTNVNVTKALVAGSMMMLALSGCDFGQERAMAGCKLDLARYSIKLGEQGLYLNDCMRAAGYTYAVAGNSYDATSYRTDVDEVLAWFFPPEFKETREIDPVTQKQLLRCETEVDRQHLLWERRPDGKMPAFNYISDCMETTGFHYNAVISPRVHCADDDFRCDMLDAENWVGRES
jgi:hypothetical protein